MKNDKIDQTLVISYRVFRDTIIFLSKYKDNLDIFLSFVLFLFYFFFQEIFKKIFEPNVCFIKLYTCVT